MKAEGGSLTFCFFCLIGLPFFTNWGKQLPIVKLQQISSLRPHSRAMVPNTYLLRL